MATSETRAAPTGRGAARIGGGVLLALAAVYLIWGSTYLMIRVTLGSMPPLLMAGVRFLLAGTLLFAIMRARGAPLPSLAQWRGAALMGVLMLALGNGGVVLAEQWVTSSTAALMVATTPLWAALWAGLWGQWPTRREWLGMALGLTGVGLLSLGGELRAQPLGLLLLLFAPMGWALGTVLGRRLTLPQGLMASAAQMLSGGALLTALSLASGERLLAMPSTQAWLAFGYLVLLGSLLAYSAFTYLIQNARPTLSTSYAYVNPIVAVALGVAFGGEPLSATMVLALLLVVAGVGLTVFQRS